MIRVRPSRGTPAALTAQQARTGMRWIAQPAVQVGIRSRGQALGPQAAVGEQALFQGSDGTQAAGYAPTQGDLGRGELRRGEDLSLADVLQLLNPTASATRVGVGPRGGPRCARPSRAGGGPRMFAAATASWTAKLMPTPPTGSITCAASPSNNRPGRYQRGTRLASSGSNAVWTRSWSKSMRSASQGSSACSVTWTGSVQRLAGARTFHAAASKKSAILLAAAPRQ